MASRTFLYVSCAAARRIDVFSLDGDSGALTLCQRVAVAGSPLPLYAGYDGKRLYAGVTGEDALLAYSIDGRSGGLALLGGVPSPGAPTYTSCDAAARTAYVASYRGNLLAAFALDTHGVPTDPVQTETDLPHAHAALPDRSGRWLLVPLLGADEIRVFQQAGGGRILPHSTVRARAGSGPRHLVILDDNRNVYCLNELDGSVDQFIFDDVAGTLRPVHSASMMPPGFRDPPWAAELRVSPDGRFLFATDRRSSTVAVLSIEPPERNPVRLGSYPTEAQPRGMAIDPSGRWLVVAGQLSGHLAVYEVDGDSGQLRARHRHITGDDPICVEAVALAGQSGPE